MPGVPVPAAFDAPLTLPCGVRLVDRLALAPLTNTQSAPDGTLGDDELRWLRARAEGGFRFVSTCAAWVHPTGQAWRGQLGVADDRHLPGLTRLARALHDAGSVAVVQLHHGGAKATQAPGGPLGPSEDAAGTRAATEAELIELVDAFAGAAARAEAAGFDGVELHGANGYLFTQFLGPLSNRRQDAWGGDLEGRARLLRQAVQAVRARVSPGFAVGVRLSPVDTLEVRGIVLADSLQVVRWLAEDGVDFVHLSLRDGAAADADGTVIARACREALPSAVALFAAGGVWTADDALRLMDAGADVVVVGKAAIGTPDWPRAMRTPGFVPLRPPFTRDHLRAVAVGPAFLAYLEGMRGLVAAEDHGDRA